MSITNDRHSDPWYILIVRAIMRNFLKGMVVLCLLLVLVGQWLSPVLAMSGGAGLAFLTLLLTIVVVLQKARSAKDESP